MKRLRLSLDIDGVVYNWHSIYRYLANAHLGANLPPVEDVWQDEGGDADFLTSEQRTWLWTEGVRRGLFRYGHIIKGAVEALREIATFADIIVVTHRPTAYHLDVSEEFRRMGMQDTMDWLAYLHLPFTNVHILPKGTPKSSISCDAYIDDSPRVMDDLATHTPAETLILLWDRPWNRKYLDGGKVVRVYSWAEVIGHLRDQEILIQETLPEVLA